MSGEQQLEELLASGKPRAIIAVVYENERPLQGAAGMLDWRFKGEISRAIQAGEITGAPEECVYLPTSSYQLILIGAGKTQKPGERKGLSAAALLKLKKNLSGLRIREAALSRADFGGPSDPFLNKQFNDLELRVVN